MRRRLLASTLAAVAVAVVLLGVPLGVVLRGVLEGQALQATTREAEQIRTLLAREAQSPGEAAALTELGALATGARVTLVDRFGSVVGDFGGQGPPPTGAEEVALALQGEAVAERTDDALVATFPVPVMGLPHALRLERDDAGVRGDVRRAWTAIAGLGALALGGAAGLALWQSRLLARPLEDLADAARRLGQGDFSARAPATALPEVREVSGALDATAARLAATLERSRSFSADASHQLRTPLTALRLDLEALGEGEEVDAALSEVDRLESTIDELLALGSVESGDQRVDVIELAAARLPAWQSLAMSRGRQAVLDSAGDALVQARPAAVGQALQVLLDNALEHGQGTVRVQVEAINDESRGWVRACVSDEGPGIPAHAPEGRGLTLARSLVEAEGGRLVIDRGRPNARVCLVLPAAAAT